MTVSIPASWKCSGEFPRSIDKSRCLFVLNSSDCQPSEMGGSRSCSAFLENRSVLFESVFIRRSLSTPMAVRMSVQGIAVASLNDLLVINAEIAALVRAGIPLELGLKRLSTTVSGRLGALADRLVIRMESGQTLSQSIATEGDTVSPLYAAVVEAGLRSNQLSEALESLVSFGRLLQEVQRRVRLALLYPIIVAVVAYVLFCLFLVVLLPSVLQLWDVLSPMRNVLLPVCLTIQQWAWWWVPGVPLLAYCLIRILAFAGRSWSDTNFLALEPGGRGISVGSWIPGVSGVFRDLDRAQSAHMLSLLLQHEIPLPEAMRLVARLTGSRKLSAAYQRLADGLERGHSLAAEVHFETRLPPLISQLLRAGALDRELPAALGIAADIYRRRALRRVDWLRATLAPAFAVIIGGGAAFLMALGFGLPLRWLIQELISYT
ncbi:hypothetical protein GC163_15045 [bacterium]|nr:hypothetical protein [bacterium]